MNRIDGREVRGDFEARADVIVVGSGPAGSAVAREVSNSGASVIVLEEGRWFEPGDFPLGAFDSMSQGYRDMSSSVVIGRALMPYVQGRMVGGSSPINGAICWRLPKDVHDEWIDADPALADALPWPALEAITDELEQRLNVAPTDPAVAGRKNELMARGAEALGLEHRPIRRNVTACEGLGRCLQGCPKGRKNSTDRTLLADAEARGAAVASSIEVTRIMLERGRAIGVEGRSAAGGRVRVLANRAVVLAASAIQSPVLLLRSGLDHGPVGRHFQCHPGVSISGRFAEPIRMWEGATQGHEVIGLRRERLKFEALGFDLAVLASRLPGVGRAFAKNVHEIAHHVDWGVAVRAETEGRVRSFRGRPLVCFTPGDRDVARFRRGLRVMGEMMLAAGAQHVASGVRGVKATMSSVEELVELEQQGPSSASAYLGAITHMFGTCRMGSDPQRSVVRPDFRHHGVDRLYVADSSVFRSNLGVNPQIPIMAIATLCGRRIVDHPT